MVAVTAIDPDLLKRIQLVAGSPKHLVRISHPHTVTAPVVLSEQDGFYFVGGTTTPAGGRSLNTVFVVDTDSAAELCGYYWEIDSQWHDGADMTGVLTALALEDADVFPVDYVLNVPAIAPKPFQKWTGRFFTRA